MPSDNRQQVRHIFMEVADLPEADRAAALSRACAGDATLRAEVEALLHAEAQAGGFMASPTADVSTTPSSAAPMVTVQLTEDVGTHIGAYKLLQLIGEGGFGSVFMAEQEKPVIRKVALKIIKLGMDTRQVVARFEQERQALAMMDHPNIARVFDAGATDSGRPYFVMELVRGDPIVEYCDRNNLSVGERLDLFAQVCNAVQHAHTKGIIHRDIKPSNILVTMQDGRPSPKVIDFGIAKATSAKLTEKTLFTEHRQLIGTPEYMSPEQAEGTMDIDTRTDVYSLGVLLYELLTGSTPFSSKNLRSAAYAEIQRIIREVEPPKPSTRLSQDTDTIAAVAARRHTEPRKLGMIVRGELDWIVMKALEKDRQRRYETANGLAMDIRRYLAGEAVVAAPPGTLYRVRKFVKRHRSAVISGGMVITALVLATGVSVWFGVRESTARQRESEQRSIAEANAAAEVKARTLAEAINEFVTKALQSGDPREGGEQDTTITQAMQNAIKDIESGSFKNDPATEAALRDTIATILQNNGKYAQAQPQFEQALQIRERLFKSDDFLVAESLNNLAGLYVFQGQLSKAEPLHLRALAIFEKVKGPNDPTVASSLTNLASVYVAQGEYAKAEPLSKRAVAINEKVLGPDHADMATTLFNLAALYQLEGKFAEAEPLYKRSLAISERVFGPDHTDVASTLNSLATMYVAQDKLDLAEPLQRRAVAIVEKVLGPDHPDLAASLNNLAMLYKDQGHFKQAEPLLKRALKIREKTFGPDHPNIVASLYNLARVEQSLGNTAEARQDLDAAVAMLRRLSPNGSTELARMLWRSASARMEVDDAAAALPELQEALAMAEKLLPPENPQLTEYRETLAKCREAIEAKKAK